MWRITLKNLFARKFRLLTTSFAVMLGVAFVAGSMVLSATINKTFDDLFAGVYKDTDAVVRGPLAFTSDESGEQRGPIADTLLPVVRSVEGVARAEGDIQGFAQLTDKAGEPLGSTAGPPTFGGVWYDDPDLNPFRLQPGGRAPVGPGEVVIDAASATEAGYTVGEELTVLTAQAPQQFRISGIARFGEVDSPAGATYALFDLPTAQKFIGRSGEFDTIAVVAEDGISQREVSDRIDRAVPTDIDVVTGEAIIKESQDSLKDALAFFSVILYVFAGVSLFVGSFIINNTFSILVAQRQREMALLRAVGARRGQVLGAILFESLLVGVVAAIVGLFVGIGVAIGLKAALQAFGLDLPASGITVPPSTAIVALVAGVSVTVLSAVLPARRAARIPPIAALRDVALDRSASSKWRAVTGTALTTIGVALIALGLYADIDRPYIPVLAGLGVTFLGVATLGPFFARPAAAILGAPVRRFRGVAGMLARENAMRNPRRTSATAAALLIGVTLVTLLYVFASSLKESVNETVDRSFSGDYVIQGPFSFDGGGLSPQLARDLAALPEVDTSLPIRAIPAEVDGRSNLTTVVDGAAIERIIDAEVKEGSLADLVGPTDIALHTSRASARNLGIGDFVPVRFAGGPVQQFRIVATYENGDLLDGNQLLSPAAYEANRTTPAADQLVLVTKKDDVAADRARSSVEAVTGRYANADLTDQTEFKEQQSSQIDQVLNFMLVMLALSVLIALLGIANTLALSLYERTRELGLLRAVGMTRRQLRTSVRWESVITALMGTIAGLVLGTAFAAALVTSLRDEGVSVLAIPWGVLAIIALVAAIAGVVAAVWPARRAARLDILRAIATT